MYRFDEYTNKINSTKKIIDNIMRFKVLIISVIAVIITLVVGFLSTKGIVTSSFDIETHFQYGENIEFTEAKSLFSDAYYEYSVAGSDVWTKEKPSVVGKYMIRIASKRTFGVSYSEAKEFIIGKKITNINILSSSIEYGAKPEYSADILSSDKIEVIDFKYEDITKDTTKIYADVDSVKVISNDGKDVSEYYDFKALEKEITITPITVSIKPSITSKVYDGTPIEYDYSYSLDSGSILENDTVSFEINEKLGTLAGDYSLNIKDNSLSVIKELDGESYDVTSHYIFNTIEANYNISKRDVSITTPAASWSYDGLPHESKEGFEMENVVSGDSLNVLSSTSIIDAGTLDNEFTLKFINSDNEDVTDCYNVNFVFGTLEIKPVELNVNVKEIPNKVYDKLNVSYLKESNNYDSINEKLPNGEVFVLDIGFKASDGSIIDSVVNAGSYTLYLKDFEVENGNKNNYSISINEQVFVISPKEAILELNNINKVYDGNILEYIDGFYDSETNEGFDLSIKYKKDDLVYDSIVDAGKYEVIFDGLRPNNNYLTSNYNVTGISSKATITPKEVTIKPSVNYLTNEATYCGKIIEYINESYNYEVVDGCFIKDDGISIKASCDIEVRNSGEYTFKISGYDATSNTNINNYDISCDEAVLYVSPKSVGIAPNEEFMLGELIYNGEEHLYNENVDNNFLCTSGEFVEGEGIRISLVSNSIVNSGEYQLTINDFIYLDNTLASNYSLSTSSVTITIKPRKATLRPSLDSIFLENVNSFYDGNEKVYSNSINNFIDVNNDILEKDSFIIYPLIESNGNISVIKNAGHYILTIDSIQALEQSDVDNYDFTFESLEFDIAKRTVTIDPSVKIVDFIYDGIGLDLVSPYYDQVDYLSELDILSDDFNHFKFYRKIASNEFKNCLNAGEYSYSLDFECYDDIVNNNYEITANINSFSILMRKVTIMPSASYYSDNLEYNGEVYNYSTAYGNFDFLMDAETGFVYNDNFKYIIDVTAYQNDIEVSVLHAGIYQIRINSIRVIGFDNYEIEYDSCEIKVNPRKTSLSPNSSQSIYNGKEFVYKDEFNNFNQDNESNKKIIASDSFKISVDYYDYYTNELSKPLNANSYYIRVKEIEAFEGSYLTDYDFTYIDGILTINPKSVLLDLLNIENKTYDGKALLYPDYENNFTVIDKNGFVEGESFKIIGFYYSNNNYVEAPLNAATYKFMFSDIESTNGYLRTNYSVSLERNYIDFEITPRNVTISLLPIANKVYDGISISYDRGFNEESLDKIVEGEEFGINVSFIDKEGYFLDSILHVGVYDTEAYMYKISDNANINNYNFTYNTFEIEIYKSNLIVSLPDILESFEYYSEPYSYPTNYGNFTIVEGILYNDDSLMLNIAFMNDDNVYFEIEEVGVYTVFINDYVANTGYQDYNVTLDKEYTITIVERRIVIKPYDFMNKDFDGIAYTYNESFDNYVLVETSGFDGEVPSLKINVKFVKNGTSFDEALNVGTYTPIISSFNFLDEKNNKRYNVIFEDGNEFTISPRNINIKPVDDDVTYNGGKYIPSGEWEYVSGSYEMLQGDSIKTSISTYDLDTDLSSNAIDVGSYALKIVSYDIDSQYDAKNYNIITSPGRLEITPRTVTIKPRDFSYTYNGNSHYYSSNTVYDYFNDSLEFVNNEGVIIKVSLWLGEIKFDSVISVNAYESRIDSYSFNDGTKEKNYNIKVESGIFKIEKVNVTLSPLEDNFDRDLVYDGNEFNYIIKNHNYNADVQVPNEGFIIYLRNYSIVDAGTYVLSIDSNLVKACEGTDLNNYNLTFNTTSISIRPRKLSISLILPDDYIYNGKEYSYPKEYGNYILTDGVGLAKCDGRLMVEALVDDYESLIPNAGYHTLNSKGFILENGKLSNYTITCSGGSFYVSKKNLIVNLLPIEDFVYMGNNTLNPYKSGVGNYASQEGLVDTEKLCVVVKYSSTLKDVKQYSYNIDTKNSYILRNGVEKLPLDSNYNASSNNLSFNITPLEINVSNMNNEVVYSGETYKEFNSSFTLLNNLCDDDKFEMIGLFSADNLPRNVGKYLFSDIRIKFKKGNASNYNIVITETGSLKILKKELIIDIEDYEMEYGDSLLLPKITENGLVDGDTYNLISYSYLDENGNEVNPLNSGVYYTRINYEISPFASNYDIKIENGKLTIKPKKVDITIEPFKDKTYDGVKISYSSYYGNYLSVSVNLVFKIDISFKLGDASNSQTLKEIVNAGRYYYYISDFDVIGELKDNYSLQLAVPSPYITIAKQQITVNTGGEGADFTYDGKYHYVRDEVYLVDGTLVNGHYISFAVEAFNPNDVAKIDAGEYLNDIPVAVYDGNDNNVTDNYEISKILGKFIIKPRKVLIELSDFEKVYDGKAVTYKDVNPIISNLVEGHKLEMSLISNDGTQTQFMNVIDTLYKLKIKRIYYKNEMNANVEVKLTNYDFSHEAKVMKINKAILSVSMEDCTLIYNGNNLSYNTSKYVKVNGLIGDVDTISYNISVYDENGKNILTKDDCLSITLKDAGIYKIEIVDIILGKQNEQGSNYLFDNTDAFATFTILKKDIKITTRSMGFVYDGKPHDNKDDYRIVDYEDKLFLDYYNYKVTDYSTVTSIDEGRVKNELVFEVTYVDAYFNEFDVTNNFNFVNVEPGELYIVKKVKVSIIYFSKEYSGNECYGINNIYTYNYYVFDIESNNLVDVSVSYTYHLVDDTYNLITPINCGKYKAIIDGVRLFNNEGVDITDLLEEIKWNNDLPITDKVETEAVIYRRIIYLKPSNVSMLFDNTVLTLSDQNFEVFTFNNRYIYKKEIYDYIYGSSDILTGDDYSIRINSSSYLSKPGTTNSYIDYAYFVDSSGNVIANIGHVDKQYTLYQNYVLVYGYIDNLYDISYWDNMNNNSYVKNQFKGTMEVKRRTIEIDAKGGTKEYDGTKLCVNEWNYGDNSNKDGLLLGDKFIAKNDSYGLITVGTRVNRINFYVERDGALLNASDYYDIIYRDEEENKLVVTKRTLTITTASLSEKYDSTKDYINNPLVAKTYTQTGLVAKDKIRTIVFTGKLTGVGTALNTVNVDFYDIRDKDGNKINYCYEVVFVYGTLEIYR